jgi:hypothetical protein
MVNIFEIVIYITRLMHDKLNFIGFNYNLQIIGVSVLPLHYLQLFRREMRTLQALLNRILPSEGKSQ